jgi:hypothetical protein
MTPQSCRWRRANVFEWRLTATSGERVQSAIVRMRLRLDVQRSAPPCNRASRCQRRTVLNRPCVKPCIRPMTCRTGCQAERPLRPGSCRRFCACLKGGSESLYADRHRCATATPRSWSDVAFDTITLHALPLPCARVNPSKADKGLRESGEPSGGYTENVSRGWGPSTSTQHGLHDRRPGPRRRSRQL